ncbi:hypothetical protein [Arcobacter sp. L]|uniref:hypothetical protein n=1 Tax=Arcobacter sp. L TaxID=944547 RepID=UPI0002296449|nr:hypothetical protein [Arcobacter sp. L]BAK73155.1 hypothetical protein ABLL_1280 [Arcobacter sp. L]
MKKLSVSILLASTLLFGEDNSNHELAEFFEGLEKVMPSTASVVKDYFAIKTCKKNFYETVDINEIKLFVSSNPTFTFLMALHTLEDEKINDINQSKYRQILNDYLFMNCGEGNIFNKKEIFIENSSNEILDKEKQIVHFS